ncbi:AMP-binding protein [Gordonia sp. PKS22-38]|uniref:AMP-binding protein n=1 Tax=Gordonia prachuapensis TaxID=3115651 RepID=A0ABU7MRR0_9ACTN|nr:AMP-binding protein [Gordonia sp. PKS22-38]
MIPPTHVLRDRWSTVIAANGERVAVDSGSAALSYTEFGRQVESLGDRLTDISAGRPVAVVLDGSTTSVSALLAVLMSGHPAVPIDAALPRDRMMTMVEAVSACPFPGLDTSIPAVDAGSDGFPTAPDCLMIAFTSGTTGRPKAVLHPVDLWLNQIDELGHELGLRPGHRAAQALPVGYGGGLDITLSTLFNGATLYLVDPRHDGVTDTLHRVARSAPDSLHLTPALLRAICAQPEAGPALRSIETIATCGEAVDPADIAALRSLAPSTTYINRSGSSETGNLACNVFAPARVVPSGPVIAGRPARHKAVRIVDDSGVALPDGEIGRVEVTSGHIALGYWIDGRVQAFGDVGDGRRRHVLGDRGVLRDGELHLVGRSDDTVKVRGYRVDTAEIITAARAVVGITDAAVTVHPDRGAGEIVAYLAAGDDRPPSVADIRRSLAATLPAWMQPTHLVVVPALPRTRNGKVDRAALPEPVQRPARVAPASRTERLLVPMCEDLLSLDDIGVTDDFLALGGDSLTAVELVRRIDDTFGVRLSPSAVFTGGDLRSLAEQIDAVTPPEHVDVLVELSQPSGAARNVPIVFAFAGAGEAALALAPLARRLPAHRVVGLQAHALETRGVPDWTLTAAARRCVRHITAIDPTGPYVFVGHSIGGVIAMEAARILTDSGRQVEHVVCLDTILSGPLRRRSSVQFSTSNVSAAGSRSGDAPVRSDVAVSEPTPRLSVWSTRAALLTAGWRPRPAEEQWALFHELGRRSAMMHRLRRFDGHLTAILAEDNPDPSEWWRDVAPNCAAVHRVGGDHNGMLRAPHVDRTAELVRSVLADVGARPSGLIA